MRLSAAKLKEAIFCSCQLIIEEGREGWRDGGDRIFPIPLEAVEGREMEVMEGSGFEVLGGVRVGVRVGTLREEVDGESVLHFECFSLCAPAPLAGISVWSLASKSASHSPQHVPLNILKSNM